MGGFWSRRSIALYLAAWAILGLMLGSMLAGVLDAGLGASLLFALPLVLVYAGVCGFSAYYLCRAFPLASKPLGAVLGVFVASALCAALFWCAAGSAWAALWQALGPAPGQSAAPAWQPVRMTAPVTAAMFGVGVLLYGMTACLHYLAREFERARALERRELELALLARDAELRMLRTQVDPHFLFNSLNSISALTAIDAGAARDMTLQLAAFFRHTLGLEAQRKVTLGAEVDLVGRFLAIEGVRFGPRLAFEARVDPAAARCLVPPMLLQPLVENAVKHGIGGLVDGGAVRVHACRAGSQLKIRVENDVDPDAGAPRRGGPEGPGSGGSGGSGFGLANVRARLAAAYGLDASAHAARDATTFRVELLLPADDGDLACAP